MSSTAKIIFLLCYFLTSQDPLRLSSGRKTGEDKSRKNGVPERDFRFIKDNFKIPISQKVLQAFARFAAWKMLLER